MKTFVNLRQYLAEVFLELEMFQTKFVEKIKIHILCSNTGARTNCIIRASGISNLCKRLYSMPDESRVCSHPAYYTAVYRE